MIRLPDERSRAAQVANESGFCELTIHALPLGQCILVTKYAPYHQKILPSSGLPGLQSEGTEWSHAAALPPPCGRHAAFDPLLQLAGRGKPKHSYKLFREDVLHADGSFLLFEPRWEEK